MDFLRARRVALGWSQAEVAKRCGVTRSRVSEFEAGERVPSPEQLTALCAALGLPIGLALPDLAPKVYRSMRTSTPTALLTDCREAWERVVKTYAAELECLRCTPDLGVLARAVKIDSALEGLALWQLIARGAVLCAANPHLLGFGPHPVLQADLSALGPRRLPCLLWQGSFWRMIVWPQVTLRVGTYSYRLDALVLLQGGGKKVWGYYEIDGSGHNPAWDRQREERLDLPFVRFTQAQVEGLRFPELLEAEWKRRLIAAA